MVNAPTHSVELAAASRSLTSFIPAGLAARLTKHGSEPAQTPLGGAVVFADIVGFTEITERYSHHGDEGLEKVSELLNTIFARYVDEVGSSGGEVVIFAGDALLAYWPAETPENLGQATHAAAACAARMLGVRYESLDGYAGPELHIGLAAGSLWAARVGSVPVGWQLLLGGVAVREAVAAQALAKRGQIIVATSAARLLGSERVIESGGEQELRKDDFDPTTGPLGPASLTLSSGSWPMATLPRVVRERWTGRPGAWVAELRSVTPVFIRIDGLDDAHPNALEQLQQVCVAIQDIVHAFSAERGSLLIDDKGLVFLIVFGVPYNAHADDLARAVRMALAIERRIESLGLRCAMGVAAGKAFCGVLGSRSRCEYSTVGPAMNRAARLMAASGRGLLCPDPGDDTLRQPDLLVEPGGRLKLKGSTTELEVVRVRSRTAIPDTPRDLCGRVAEQSALDKLLDGLSGGDGCLVTIVGEAGLGKSALVLDFLERARQRGIHCVHGQADPEAKVSYGAWRNVLVSVLGLGGDLAGGTPEETLRRSLARCERADLLPLIAPLLGLATVETKRTERLRGAARADATLQLLTDVMQELAPAPIVIVLEDVHRMDSASWRLVERVTNLIPGLMLVITSRSAEAPGLKDAARTASRCHEIVLGPLDADASIALARKLLGGQDPPSGLLPLVEQRSAGNPLYIVECVMLLSDALRGGKRGDSSERDSKAHGSVRALITSRLDRLSPRQELALKTASVVGTTFNWTLVEHLLGRNGLESPELLQGLVQERLITPVGGASAVFRFSHELVRDVAYDLMLVQQRRAVHGAVALALEDEASVPKPAAALAHHWLMAANHRKTLTWSDQAGNEALETGAFDEAAHHFRRCLETIERVEDPISVLQRLAWNRKLSDAYTGLGDLAARAQHARAGLMLVGEKPGALGSTTTFQALCALAFADFRPRLRQPQEERLEIAAFYRHLAHVAYFESDGPGLFVATLRAVQAAEHCPPSPALCGSLAELGGALGLGGMHSLALRYLERAVKTAEGMDHPHGLAYVHMVRGLYLVGRGQWEPTLTSAERCQSICEAIGDSVTWGNAQIVRFWVAYYRGQFEAAESAGAALVSRAQRKGNHQQEAWGLRGLALIRLQQGDPAAALLQLQAARRGLPPTDANESMPTFAAIALCHWQLGDRERAMDVGESALALAQKLGRPTGHATLAGLLAIVELALVADDSSIRAHSMVEQAIDRLDAYQRVFPIGLPSYSRLRGLLSRRQGQRRRAERLLERGLEAARRLDMAKEVDLITRQIAESRGAS